MKKIIKAIYSLIPFKKQMFSILKNIWTPKKSIYQHLYFKGEFEVIVEGNRKFKLYNPGLAIENGIFWNGLFDDGWERDSIKIWIELCKKSKTIFDIGANTGIYSLVAKAIAPDSTVYAFEPHPYFYSFLKKNNGINKFDVVCIDKAASDNNGSVVLDDFSGVSSALTFESVTLDAFIDQNKIRKIDLIKIDVEQHEPQVLSGFSSHLVRFKPTIIIEILNENIADQVDRMVQDLGYLYFNLNERGQIRQTLKIEKSDYYNYLLCHRETAVSLGLIKA